MFILVNTDVDFVTFGPDGRVVPVEGKVPMLFARELRTYRDLPEPLAAAVGRVLINRECITIGYRHGPSNALFAVSIYPFSDASSQVTCMAFSERLPRTVSRLLAAHLTIALANECLPLMTMNDFLGVETPPDDTDFKALQKTSIQDAINAVRRTCAILRSVIEASSGCETRTAAISVLWTGSLGGTWRPDNWTCHGDEALTFCGNIRRLESLFRSLLKGCLGESKVAIHWTEDSHMLGVSAVEFKITDFIWADRDGTWRCALQDTIIEAQGCVEFLPVETPTCLYIWLPLHLPEGF